MTLGNDPQPLTRRQARELAERQAQSSSEHDARHPEESSASGEPATTASNNASADAASRAPQSAKAARRARTAEAAVATQKPGAQKPGAQKPAAQKSAVQKPAAQKPAAQKSTVKPEASDGAESTQRTWTRRELRARDAAARPASDAAVASDTGDVTAVPQPVPASPSSSSTPAPMGVDESVPVPPVPASHGRNAASRPDSTTPVGVDTNQLPGLHPPVGHWSVDRDDENPAHDGQTEPFDQLMGRGLGAGGIPTTTNALILPAIPNQGSTSGPLADSGEILITGSFDLPRSLGSTGQLPNHFDSSEMDHMLDQFDDDGAPGAAAPVSASRAVSTHASTRNVLAAPKRRMPSLPAVLAITAAVLALGVLALFVGGYLLNIF